MPPPGTAHPREAARVINTSCRPSWAPVISPRTNGTRSSPSITRSRSRCCNPIAIFQGLISFHRALRRSARCRGKRFPALFRRAISAAWTFRIARKRTLRSVAAAVSIRRNGPAWKASPIPSCSICSGLHAIKSIPTGNCMPRAFTRTRTTASSFNRFPCPTRFLPSRRRVAPRRFCCRRRAHSIRTISHSRPA